MSVNAIYASKLFKASKRKDKIRAAAQNPLNSELILQLDEYVDDKYKQPKKKTNPAESKESKEDESEEKIRPSKSSGGGFGGGGFSGPSDFSGGSDHHLSDMLKDEEGGDFGSDAPAPDFESKEKPDDSDVAESTQVKKQKILSSTELSSEVDAIIGLLNSREDTTGVCRGLIKDKELWIHYKDAINLNNVMEPIIALLNASNYDMLDFNRLARTENAIVFSISETPQPVEPIQEIVDEEK